jgi:transcriptional regulator with XRE-family HTH domain
MGVTPTVGELVRLHRLAANISQRKLGTDSGVHETTIWRIETNGVMPSISTLISIARALGVTIEDLFPRGAA